MKKHLSLVLMISAIVFLPLNQAVAFSGSGSGTPENPYVITTAAQLNEVRNNLEASYQLGADIDLSAYIAANSPVEGWEPLGYGEGVTAELAHPFKGTFDGAGHFITGIWSNRPTHNWVGLFGQVSGFAVFKNLGVSVAEGKSIKGQENVGGIAGWLTNLPDGSKTTITNCVVIGSIEGSKCVGGLVGLANWNSLTIINSYAAGSIVSAGDGAGGILGSTWGNLTIDISNSYAVNSVTAVQAAAGIQGGASANNAGNIWLKLHNNVAINPTIDGGTIAQRVLGYVKSGANLDLANYAFAGTLTNGLDEWFGELTNTGGEDATLAQIKNEAFYTGLGWDFTDVWTLGNGNYPLPVLKGLNKSLQPKVAPAHVPGGNSLIDGVNVGVFGVTYKDGQLLITNKPANVPVEIYDYTGRLLLKKPESSINISSLNSGIYVVKAGSEAVKIVKK
jgi:hypothetical protein